MPNQVHQIGVDGGGSKTDLILIDATGEIVARHNAGGCNPNHAGTDHARGVLTSALAALLDKAGLSPNPDGRDGTSDAPIAGMLMCMAGNRAFWAETAASLRGYGKVIATDDAAPVLELATGGDPGLVIHAGTGSFVAARAPDGTIRYAGGLGWKLGDPGSGFDLGRRAIAHALLELQGWEKPTALSEALKEYTSLGDAASITRRCYAAENANAIVAGFAPRVVALAAQGCVPAQSALAATLMDLAAQANLVLARLFPEGNTDGQPIPMGISGALLNSEPAVHALKAIAATNSWNADLRFITEPAIEGTRRLLMKMRAPAAG